MAEAAKWLPSQIREDQMAKRIAELEATLCESSAAIQLLRTAIDSGGDTFTALVATAPVQAAVDAVLAKSTS